MAVSDWINPFYAAEAIARTWIKATYNTPIQSMPVFGVKSSLNPLGRAYREAYSVGEYAGKPEKGFFVRLGPASPKSGPPLPAALGIKWPQAKT
jgi:hypothetical protein